MVLLYPENRNPRGVFYEEARVTEGICVEGAGG
ncbi:MAG: hypothetical protein RI897_1783 [Verrucomicrobiota bacterium]|jgi:hypothetical protein